jgi:Fic family protein
MPKNIANEELTALEAVIRERPDGVSMMDLVGPKATEAQRRAMQRRLKKLIASGRVKSSGKGKGTRYYLSDQPGPPQHLHQDEAALEAEGGLFVPLSEAGQKLQKLVRRPEAERPPVGYVREFLSNYKPNTTFYLSPRERKFLADVGVVEMGPQKPAGTYARKILDRLLIDLSWNSSRLEGNTYSILDTKQLLEAGKRAEGKTAQETQMILNHKDAIEFLIDAANEIGFNRHTILNLHGLLSHDLLDPTKSGRLRPSGVTIGGSSYLPLQIPAVAEEVFMDLLAKANSIADPFEQSFFASIHIPYLQPFADVNKRVSRLAANIPFVKRNLSPVSFIDVPEQLYVEAMLSVYEMNKTELARDMFVWAYERSARRYSAIRQSLGEPDPFRMRYREEVKTAVSRVIIQKMSKSQASKEIAQTAVELVPQADRPKFAEIVESELIGMHEGNFARFRIRPSEFFAWKAVWEAT